MLSCPPLLLGNAAALEAENIKGDIHRHHLFRLQQRDTDLKSIIIIGTTRDLRKEKRREGGSHNLEVREEGRRRREEKG
jgi:hypothetical protein